MLNIIYGGYAMLEYYPDVLKPRDLSVILRISMKQTYSLLHTGEIEHRKIGRKYFICKTSLIKFLANT